ncbi:MAG: Gfo/Idh/MocA family oxidoreductase [Rhodospirillaceae bacterium]|jgi:predicted dehydrogenase|nr:Gfo/Idh/MocA family oxidoreductase [Rhodospirillaceae bacterium]MBT5563559.1 Gfo/Idh/MocA family oxidoreductase [Rhodospirillaceae bacterium]MBT7137716.1 Gfo/Idh/MocA family oxidoreductase [Rhodospirillaceae bacterium]
MIEKLRIAQLGLGYWGQNLLRNLLNNSKAEVTAVCDPNQSRLASALERVPTARAYQSIDDVLRDQDVQAVSIATPSGLHFAHAAAALRAGKSVFVEKPMTTTLEDAVALAGISSDTGKLVMVGHTYLYNSIVQSVKKYLCMGELGQVYYAHSQRLNLGRFRHDSDVIWTLSPHDISIFNFWFDDCPYRVSARTMSYIGKDCGHAEICFAQLDYANGISAHLHLSWLDPQKVRRSIIAGSRKMLVYDDVDQNRSIQIFDKSQELDDIISENSKGYSSSIRVGNVHIPNLVTKEPLYLEMDQFIDSVTNSAPCPSDIRNGVWVTAIMDALSRSARNDGVPICVDYPSVMDDD